MAPASPPADVSGSASDDVLNDSQLAPFLADDFDRTEYATKLLGDPGASASRRTEALQRSAGALDEAIHAEVAAKQDDLLAHARRLQTSERSLQQVKQSLGGLSASAQRMRRDVVDPFQSAQQQATQLRNLHQAMEVLRAVNHRTKQAGKLRQIMGSGERSTIEPMDLAKAAKLLLEIESMSPEEAVRGITVVDKDLEFIHTAREQVVASGHELLRSGLSTLSQADIAAALQIFFNLHMLREVVAAAVHKQAAAVDAAVHSALDARQLGAAAAGAPTAGRAAGGAQGGGRLGDALWAELEGVMARMHEAAVATWHLQRIVAKKRDPLTLTAFSSIAQEAGPSTQLDAFWAAVADALRSALQHAVSRGGLVRDALTQGFPRLQVLLEAALDRCTRDSEAPGAPPAVAAAHRAALMRTLAPFREASMSASLARLQEAAGALYPSATGALPSAAAVQQYIGTLHDELNASAKSPALAALTAAAAGRALGMLTRRAGALMAPASELRSIAGAASAAQLRNIALCSQLHEVQRSLLSQLPKLAPAAAEVLAEPLEHLQSCAVEAVLPLFRAAAAEVEATILEMHSRDWSGDAAQGAAVLQPSGHMRRLDATLRRFRREHLSHFVPQPAPNVASSAALLCQRLAGRALAFFVRHAALIKPLGQQGKLQLARDAAELEQMLRQHLAPPDLVRDAHSHLRSFRTLLFTDADAVQASGLLATLPQSTVLLHLVSRLPEAAPMPYERTGVTAQQFSQWMDQHTQAEVVKAVMDAVPAGKLSGSDRGVFEVMQAVAAH